MKKILLLVFTLFFVQIIAAQGVNSVDDTVHNLDEVEIYPQFPGGHTLFIKFIAQNFVMPDYNGRGGILKMGFVIEKDGTISGIKTVQHVGDVNVSREAARVIATSPNWSPAQIGGKNVRVFFEVPIQIANHM